jgi:FolB domain-containing protein
MDHIDMNRIFIKDLLVRGIIGINDWERENPQDIIINISMFVDLVNIGVDNIENTVNYKTVTKKVIKHVEEIKRLTVEALAEDIASICLSDKRVEKVTVRVEKPGAVRFAKSVGIEIERVQI